MKASILPFLAFAACALIWGSTFLAIRAGNDTLPPLWACSLRFLLAALILGGILLVTRQPWPRGAALRAAAGFGLLEFGVSMPLLYWGEQSVPSGLAAVVFAICPIAAMITARLMGMEKLSPIRLAAAGLAFCGVAVIFWKELLQGASQSGLICVFLSACAAPLAGLLLQRGPKQGAFAPNAVGVLIGFAVCLALSFAAGESHPIPKSFDEIFPVVYLALAGSVGAFVLFAWLVQRWRATTTAFLGVIVPVIAVILGSVVRQESLAAGSFVGAIIVVLGVTIALRTEPGI